MCSYLFVSMAYGIMMEEAGFRWYYSLFVSMTVYTGAFQFVLITFLNDFKKMGKRKLYMIHTMTDEAYAVNCTLELPEKEKYDTMFLVALLSRCYWMAGAVAGGILGQLIPFKLDGIDFCMTALFVIIFLDQWEKAKKHGPALTGLIVGLAALLIFGQTNFMLPALLLTSGLLILSKRGGTVL